MLQWRLQDGDIACPKYKGVSWWIWLFNGQDMKCKTIPNHFEHGLVGQIMELVMRLEFFWQGIK